MKNHTLIKPVGVALGPALAALMLFVGPPAGLSDAAWVVAVCAVWTMTWWITEALPLPATGLMPLVILSMSEVVPLKKVASTYMHPIVFLFIGGFIIALAIERWNLHKRIALFILDIVGARGDRVIAGFMLTAALLSMWILNTATTLLLLPVAFSVITVMEKEHPGLSERKRRMFSVALLLGIAYAATIGGMTTLIGTAPNAVFAGFMQDSHGYEVGFAQWTLFSFPLAMVMLPLAWLVLTRVAFPLRIEETPEIHRALHKQRMALGPMSAQEKAVAGVFIATALAWAARPALQQAPFLSGLSDATVALIAALSLFILPDGKGGRLMNWEATTRLPWGLLLLLGAGLSLAAAMLDTGLSTWLGGVVGGMTAWHPLVLIIALTTLLVLLTEVTSNTATTISFLPIVGALAVQSGYEPYTLMVPVTLAASCAFMFPIATPPNAIVFSSGRVRMSEMARAGAWMNLVSAVLVSVFAYYVSPLAF